MGEQAGAPALKSQGSPSPEKAGSLTPAARGVFMVLLYNLLSATKEVVSGHIVQSIDPFALTCVAFFLVALFFQIVARGQGREIYKSPLANPVNLLWLNVTSVGAWLGFFYSVKYLEPAVVSAVMIGFGPAIAVILSPRLYKKTRVEGVMAFCAVGILAATAYLAAMTMQGLSAMGEIGMTSVAKGLASATLGSLAIVGATIYAKRVSDAGATPAAIMAHRFYLLVPAAFGLALAGSGFDAAFLAALPVVLAIALFGVLVPLWSLQVGIRHLEPIKVIIIISTAPAFTYAIQFLDDRLQQNMQVLPGIMAICLLAAISSVKKKKA